MPHLPWYKRILGTSGESGAAEGELDECGELRAGASALLDGELHQSEASSFHKHMTLCEGCESWMASFQAVVASMRGLPRESAPPDSLMQRIGTISRG